jgi:putative transposase
MAHTYVSALVHVVFSTKGRRKTISADLQPKLWAYLGGIARRNGMTAVQVGGVADHLHVLLILPATMAIAKAVQLLKGGSSKWIHDTKGKPFAWQDGESDKVRILCGFLKNEDLGLGDGQPLRFE